MTLPVISVIYVKNEMTKKGLGQKLCMRKQLKKMSQQKNKAKVPWYQLIYFQAVNVLTRAIGHGIVRACDTLVSQVSLTHLTFPNYEMSLTQFLFYIALDWQAYGSQNPKQVGIIVQKSALILLLFCLPCWGFLINFSNIMLLLHQEEEVVR